MNIALFAWEALYSCEIGGVSAHVSGLAAALAQQGHEVHLFTRETPGQNAFDLIGGVYYHRCPWARQNNFLDDVQAFNHSLAHYYEETAAQIGGFQILHCHDWLTFPAGSYLRQENRLGNACRWLVTFHTTEWGRSEKWPESGEGLRIARWEEAAVKEANAVLFISAEVRRQANLLYHCPDWKARVIYHGINTLPPARVAIERGPARAALGLTADTPAALFVGSLSERKGADILINGLSELCETAPTAKLIVAGNGPLLLRLQETLQNLCLAERVIFAPASDRWQIARLYPAADVVAVPYRYDPFGIVALSAWAAIRPVVTCGSGAAGEFVYHEVNGIKAAPKDFCRALAELLNDLERAQWLGHNGRAAADTAFSWNSVAAQTIEMYCGENESAWNGHV